MSDGQKLPAVRYRLTAYRYPLSYWTVFPKAGGGARLRRRGDSPALTRGLRVVSPKGKRLITFCASLALLHPLLSLTHWIFGSLSLSYKSSSHSAKCVRCASLRSGGRIRAAALEYIPESKRIQAPAAPGFYRSCADALTDGFCPQSGLVQRGVLYAACGGAPFGGWRHHLSPYSGGTMGAGQCAICLYW